MIILDANIILDYLLKRRNLDSLDFLETEILAITPTTLHIVYYFTEKNRTPFNIVKNYLNKFEILPFTQKTYNLAMEMADGKDFEDTLQIATALENKVEKFVTGDKNLAKKYAGSIEFIVV